MGREILEVGDFFEFLEFFNKNHGAFMEEYDWRKGQTFFNLLHNRNAVCAERLRGHLIDPFHRDEVSDKVWDFVMENWDDGIKPEFRVSKSLQNKHNIA